MNVNVLDGAVAPQENIHLFGHEEAEGFLARAYGSGRIHHAVLIEGPQGVGKATLAFRFANHVLAHPVQGEAPLRLEAPDPESRSFREIASGASHHLLHLTRPVDDKTGKARTAITVDEVRRTQRLFGQTSGTGGWRIVVVDAADDLNRNAANALLKMLEEPPKRALFLLVSHAPGRLLPTIRSRCLALRLRPLSQDDLWRALAPLPAAKALDEARRARIAARAEGSVARAVLLAQYGGLDIVETFESILEKGPVAGRQQAHALADALTSKDREETFAFFSGHVLDWIAGKARKAGEMNNLAAADALASLHSRTADDLATARAYNLDRKQVVLSLITSIFDARAA